MRTFTPLLSTAFVVCCFISPTISFSQVSFEYDRNSLSCLLLEYENDRSLRKFKNQFNPKVSEKFFFNTINNNHLPVGFERPVEEINTEEVNNKSLEENLDEVIGIFSKKENLVKKVKEHEKIRQHLENENIGAQIISIWSQKDEKGNFSTLQERVSYNYSAVDDQGMIDPKKISNVKPMFLRNYILVFDFANFSDMRTYYRKKGIDRKEVPEGWIADLTVYYYKLDIDDQLFDGFIKPNFDKPEVLQQKQYPVKYVRKYTTTVQQAKPKSEIQSNAITEDVLYKKMVADAVEKACFELERKSDDFKAKDAILQTSPIKGTIGKREGVKLDQRFYVYEKQYNENTNTTETKRVAMLRATNQIGNNLGKLKDGQGNYISTTFRKIYGKKVEEGMLLVQEKDLGFSVSGGVLSRGETKDIHLRAAYNISSLLHSLSEDFNFGGSRVFIDISWGNRPEDDFFFDEDEKATRVGIGLSKDLMLNNIIDVSPYIGYYQYSFTDNDEFEENYVKIGAQIPINVYYNTFLVADLGVTTESDFTNVRRFPVGAKLRIDF